MILFWNCHGTGVSDEHVLGNFNVLGFRSALLLFHHSGTGWAMKKKKYVLLLPLLECSLLSCRKATDSTDLISLKPTHKSTKLSTERLTTIDDVTLDPHRCSKRQSFEVSSGSNIG